MPSESLPKGTKVPNHIAIIPDGNRRWARARNIHTLKGHEAGFKRGVELGRAARRWGIHTVSFWGFSTENWDRSPIEIKYLMKLYSKMLDQYLKDAHKEKVKIVHLGRKDRLPKFLVKKIATAEEETKTYKKYIANIAIDYGGHDDIIRATKRMIKDGVSADQIDKTTFENYLDNKDQPYPYVDLLIRSSGEQRTSGLLLWQMEYAEMYWDSNHFPDMTPERLKYAILDYSRRRRRFGSNDQEEHFKFKPEVAARLEMNWWRLANIPEGTRFREYAVEHLREQWGLSKSLASEASKLMLSAVTEGKHFKWKQATFKLGKFYKLIKDEVKLAFEPSLAASLEVKLWQKANSSGSVGEIENRARKYLAEVYRISDLQATKAAHLLALAAYEKNIAERGGGDKHWNKAEKYLELYYRALKDRIA